MLSVGADLIAEGHDVSASTRSTRAPRPGVARRRRVAAAGVVIAACTAWLAGGSAGPAGADGSSYGSAMAQSAAVTNGSGVTLTAGGTGLTGSLTSALLNSALATGTVNLPNTVAGVATSALTSTAGLQASNSTNRQPRPASVYNFPVCTAAQGWVYPSGNCYSVVPTTSTPTLPTGSLVALSAGAVQGYATGDAQGFVAAAGSSHPILVLPGLSLDLGVASSNAQCTTAPLCTPSHAFTGGTITTSNGTQSFALASGSSLASVGGTTIPDRGTQQIVPNVIAATANGNFLTFTVALTLTQYLTALGTSLAALSTGLGGMLNDPNNSSTVTLAVTVGPGSISGTSATSASAWGLDVGINLIADIKLNLNLLGVGGALGAVLGTTELVTSGASDYPATSGSSPNLLDLKFAYSQSSAGALLPDFVPPGLI